MLAALLAVAALAVPAGAVTPGETGARSGPPAPGALLRFRDGGAVVEATRRGPADLATGRAPLAIRWSSGRAAAATGGAEAIVRVDDPAALAGLGLAPVRALAPELGLWLVRDAGGTADGLDVAVRLADRLSDAGPLRAAAPDLAFRLRPAGQRTAPPDDPRYGGQWYLPRIGVEDAWAIEDGEPTVTVVVNDNGCDLAHPDLAAKLDPGRDTVDGDDDPSFAPDSAGNEHGTACAGLVGAATDNGVGIAGVCPNCRLRCVRMLGADGDEAQPTSVAIEAFHFAKEVGAAVSSNSWGYVDAIPVPPLLALAIEDLVANGRDGLGTVVVFASGNDDREVGTGEILGLEGVIGVGAVTVYDEATSFTNRGEPVDLAAPVGTLTTDLTGPGGGDPGDYTGSFGGTSSACPIVSGVAGLLASAAPTATAADLEAALIDTARPAPYASPDDRGHDPVYGYGIVAPAAALRSLLGLPDPGTGGSGGTGADGTGGDGGGCGCRSMTGAPGGWALGLALLALRRRRACRASGRNAS
jgi:subtilisin family serine protease